MASTTSRAQSCFLSSPHSPPSASDCAQRCTRDSGWPPKVEDSPMSPAESRIRAVQSTFIGTVFVCSSAQFPEWCRSPAERTSLGGRWARTQRSPRASALIMLLPDCSLWKHCSLWDEYQCPRKWANKHRLKTCNKPCGICIWLVDPCGSSRAPTVWYRISSLSIQEGAEGGKDCRCISAQLCSRTSFCSWTRSTYFRGWCKTTARPWPSWSRLPSNWLQVWWSTRAPADSPHRNECIERGSEESALAAYSPQSDNLWSDTTVGNSRGRRKIWGWLHRRNAHGDSESLPYRFPHPKNTQWIPPPFGWLKGICRASLITYFPRCPA